MTHIISIIQLFDIECRTIHLQKYVHISLAPNIPPLIVNVLFSTRTNNRSATKSLDPSDFYTERIIFEGYEKQQVRESWMKGCRVMMREVGRVGTGRHVKGGE